MLKKLLHLACISSFALMANTYAQSTQTPTTQSTQAIQTNQKEVEKVAKNPKDAQAVQQIADATLKYSTEMSAFSNDLKTDSQTIPEPKLSQFQTPSKKDVTELRKIVENMKGMFNKYQARWNTINAQFNESMTSIDGAENYKQQVLQQVANTMQKSNMQGLWNNQKALITEIDSTVVLLEQNNWKKQGNQVVFNNFQDNQKYQQHIETLKKVMQN